MKKRLKNHIINNGIKIEFFNLRNFNRSIELKSSKNYLYYKFVDDFSSTNANANKFNFTLIEVGEK